MKKKKMVDKFIRSLISKCDLTETIYSINIIPTTPIYYYVQLFGNAEILSLEFAVNKNLVRKIKLADITDEIEFMVSEQTSAILDRLPTNFVSYNYHVDICNPSMPDILEAVIAIDHYLRK